MAQWADTKENQLQEQCKECERECEREMEVERDNNIASFTYVMRTSDARARDNFISSLELTYLFVVFRFRFVVKSCQHLHIKYTQRFGLRIVCKYLPKQFV